MLTETSAMNAEYFSFSHLNSRNSSGAVVMVCVSGRMANAKGRKTLEEPLAGFKACHKTKSSHCITIVQLQVCMQVYIFVVVCFYI